LLANLQDGFPAEFRSWELIRIMAGVLVMPNCQDWCRFDTEPELGCKTAPMLIYAMI
jgi:hypothetical protein